MHRRMESWDLPTVTPRSRPPRVNVPGTKGKTVKARAQPKSKVKAQTSSARRRGCTGGVVRKEKAKASPKKAAANSSSKRRGLPEASLLPSAEPANAYTCTETSGPAHSNRWKRLPRITVGSDCSGLCTEVFAIKQVLVGGYVHHCFASDKCKAVRTRVCDFGGTPGINFRRIWDHVVSCGGFPKSGSSAIFVCKRPCC